MKSIEIFRLLLRAVGLIGLLYTCRHIYHMIHKTGSWHMGWLIHTWDKTGQWDLGEARALVLEILLIIFGIYLLRGAPLLVKFMYPAEKEEPSRQGKEDPSKQAPKIWV
jgi:hypothetical protein